jgi:hypothetical protein
MNLVYCQNQSEFVRGIGKSAIAARMFRRLREANGDATAIYIRAQKGQTPAALSRLVVGEWHRDGALWRAVAQCVELYAVEADAPAIRPDGAGMLARQKWPVDRVDLRSFLVYNPVRLVNSVTDWACRTAPNLSPEIAEVFFQTYLSVPREFLTAYPKTLRKMKADEIEMLRNAVVLMGLGGYTYHYLFFDQFEEVVSGTRGRDLMKIAAEMRRLLEVGLGLVSIVVTLHPGAIISLQAPEGQELLTLAPLDTRHCVDVRSLSAADAQALAITYLKEFRTGEPGTPLFPLTPESITRIHEVAEGNAREVLRGFNLAIEEGADAGHPLITLEFLHAKHAEITGRISPNRISLA